VQVIIIEQHRVAEQEKVSLQENFEEEKAQMLQEKEQLITEKLEVKEVVNKALRYVTGLEIKVEDHIEHQVEKLAEAIQQLEQRITDLKL